MMTYLDTLMLIQERGEPVLTQNLTDLITEKHHYMRTEEGWQEDTEPGRAEPHYGRSGIYYSWQSAEVEEEHGNG